MSDKIANAPGIPLGPKAALGAALERADDFDRVVIIAVTKAGDYVFGYSKQHAEDVITAGVLAVDHGKRLMRGDDD